MADLDYTINWCINHWYYFIFPLLIFFMYNLYTQVKKLKEAQIHWVRARQDDIAKQEQKFNPSMVYKWLVKMHPFTDKMKRVGKILSYSEEPVKLNPKGQAIFLRISAKTRNILGLLWWHPTNFSFMKEDVFLDQQKKIIKIPANYFWEKNSEGTMILISPNIDEVKGWADEKMYKDAHETAIDGYASQMSSYSSVKPTWGHEEKMMDKETEGKALGFGRFLKKKKGESED